MKAKDTKVIPESPYKKTEDKLWDILNILKNFYVNHLWYKRVEAYKNYFMYKLDRGLLIKDFQTNIKSPVVKMYVDAMWTWLYDNVINFRVIWRWREDQKKADDVKAFLEWWFSVSKSRPELMATVKEALICWPWYAKIWFVDNVETLSYSRGTKKITKESKEQYPYIKYVPIFNVFYDPTAKSFDEAPYVIERNILSVSTFKKYYGSMFKNDAKINSIINYALENPRYFCNYDYNKIKQAAFRNERLVKKDFNLYLDNHDNRQRDMNAFLENYLAIEKNANYIELIEYRSEDKHILMVNGKVFKDEANPLPINKIPYVDIEYNKAPWLSFWMWLWVNLEDIQHITDELLNLQMDNTKFQIAPMFQKLKGSDMFSQDKTWLTYEPFKVVEVNTPEWMQRLELGSPEFTGTNMIQFLLQLAEMSEWLNSYSMWYQNKVERSATWVSALVQAFKSRLLPLVESMNQALAKIAEMWMWIAVVMMDENITLRSIGPDWKVSFEDLNLDDIIGKYDIEFDAQALKSATREIKRDQLLQLLNTAVTWWIDPNTWEYFIDMRELRREILDSFEMSQDLVMNSKEVVRSKSKSMLMQGEAEQKVQQQLAQSQPQQPWIQSPMWLNPFTNSSQEPWTTQTWMENDAMANWIMAGNPIVQNIQQNVPQEAWLQMEWNILNQVMA